MLRELLATFDVDTAKATSALRSIDGAINGAKGALGKLAETLIGGAVAKGFENFVKDQIEAGSRVNDLSEKLGVGTDDLQKFQFAAQLVGVGAEQAAQGLGFLNKNLGEAISGNADAAKTFTELGINLEDVKNGSKSATDFLPQLADKFAGMGSDAERTATAMKIFGKSGAALLPLLKQGAEGVEGFAAEFERLGGGMSKEFIESADAAGDEIDKLKFAFNGWKSQIAFAILPTLTRLVMRFQTWIGGLRQVSRETNLAKYAAVAMGAAAAVALAGVAVNLAKVAGVIPKGGSFFKSLFSLGWLGLVIAAVVVLGLVFEDLWVGLRGGKSVIKDWLSETLGVEKTNEFFDQLKTIIDQVQGAFKDLGPALKPILTDLMKLAVEAGPGIASAFVFVVKVVAAAIRLVAGFGEVIAKTVGAVAKLAKGDNSGIDSLGSDIGKAIDHAGDAVFGKNGLFGSAGIGQSSNNTADWMKYEGGTVAFTKPEAPYGPPNVTQQNKVNVTVQGGATPQATGEAVKNGVGDALSGQLTDALGASLAGG